MEGNVDIQQGHGREEGAFSLLYSFSSLTHKTILGFLERN